ncbi:MAG TPA: type II toxin-antitoxin system VapB family antitoxin [Thermoanaerobaculia bacterium]|nr:type II toxin-antitoxin system VapB family antitoxin [Thermoanaerobaculia bacterium]
MRTTIRLDENLLAEAKQRAARSGRTLTAVIEEALRESFSRRERPRESLPVELPAWGQGWARPGVDLDDSASLLDLMEREDAPA